MQFIERGMVEIPIYDREIPIWYLRMIEKTIKKAGWRCDETPSE